MKLLNVIGKIGAAAAAIGGLVLAGKTGFGSDLFSSKDDGVATDDLTQPVPEQTETTEVETETTAEEETSE